MTKPTSVACTALVTATIGVWLALARLAWAFLESDLSWRYVAEHSRSDAPWHYRLAGVWGGSEGSLLLFAGVVAAAAVVAARRCRTAGPVWFAAGTVAALIVVDVTLASPFGRLDVPAVRGFGLTPILEHPAMAAHPPVLYAGFGAALGAAMGALDGRDVGRWLRWCIALVTLAMALGALWSYVEQGWGGYWAWDPVENTSLLVWFAAVIAVHRPRRVWAVGPWAFVLAGACLVRSGSTPSIHGFAEQASVGWALLVLTSASVAVMAVLARAHDAAPGAAPDAGAAPVPEPGARGERAWATRQASGLAANLALVATATAIVLAGTVAPVAIDAFGSRPGAVRGVFFARLVGPLALVSIPFLLARLRRRRGLLAHAGLLLLLTGIAASTFDRSATVGVGEGQTVEAAGLTITGRGVRVEPGPRFDTQAVVATVVVDGHVLEPSLVAYPERGGVLAETAMVTRPWRDVQVTLEDATDGGLVLITVRQRPLVWVLWAGAALTAAGALWPGGPTDRRRRAARARACAPATR